MRCKDNIMGLKSPSLSSSNLITKIILQKHLLSSLCSLIFSSWETLTGKLIFRMDWLLCLISLYILFPVPRVRVTDTIYVVHTLHYASSQEIHSLDSFTRSLVIEHQEHNVKQCCFFPYKRNKKIFVSFSLLLRRASAGDNLFLAGMKDYTT